MRQLGWFALFVVGSTAACSSSPTLDADPSDLGDASAEASPDTSSTVVDTGGGLSADAVPAEGGGGPACVPPDMLIALDRTLTMHRRPDGSVPTDGPDYKSSKFYTAITAIEALTRAPLDATIRFGLELWPKRETGCLTLAQKVAGATPSNSSCATGEILVSPALSTGAKIASILDPATTPICNSTPTGQGLIEAANHLVTLTEKGRDQYILLVTDGSDWDKSCPSPDPIAVTDANAAKGIKTWVLGFSSDGSLSPGGVGVPFLNDMACSGRTAVDFAKNCKASGSGFRAVDPSGGPRLFLQAGDATSLEGAMKSVAKQVCCDCPK
jgi:hypothetical protein